MGILSKVKSYICFGQRKHRKRNMMKRPWIHRNLFVEAIETNDVEQAQKLLDDGFDVDSMLIMGKQSIFLCVERQRYAIAKLLVKRGCSLSLTNWKGQSPLHVAVAKADFEMVRLLVENRADISSVDLLGQTPLHISCNSSSLDIVKYFIRKGSCVNKKDRDGRTPLIIACAVGSFPIANYLISKGSDVNCCDNCGNSPLLHSLESRTCSETLVNCLIHAGAHVNYKNHAGETALLKVLHRSNAFELRYERLNGVYDILIEAGSDVNARNLLDQNPLHLAVAINNESLVKKLLNSKCDPNAIDRIGFVPLFYACRDEKEDLVFLLIEGGSDLKSQNWLHCKSLLKPHQSSRLFDYVLEKCRECPRLVSICKNVIRQNLWADIEKGASSLALPTSVINYLTLQPLR